MTAKLFYYFLIFKVGNNQNYTQIIRTQKAENLLSMQIWRPFLTPYFWHNLTMYPRMPSNSGSPCFNLQNAESWVMTYHNGIIPEHFVLNYSNSKLVVNLVWAFNRIMQWQYSWCTDIFFSSQLIFNDYFLYTVVTEQVT